MLWLVWTEQGEYEQWTRDLRGIFESRELAEQHAERLRTERDYNEVEVIGHAVLSSLPERGTHHRWSAHITADGQEDPGLGYDRTAWDCWLHEDEPATGYIADWSKPSGDLYVGVKGYDLDLVEAKYAELLAEARERLRQMKERV